MPKNLSKPKPVYNFSGAIQEKIAAMFLYDEPGLLQNLEIVRPEYFENPIVADIVKIIIKFFRAYTRTPTEDELLEELTAKLRGDSRLPRAEYPRVMERIFRLQEGPDSFKYVRDLAASFAKYQAVKKAWKEGSVVIEKKKNYEQLLSKVSAALLVGEVQDLGVFYYDNLDQRLADRREGKLQRSDLAIKTGLPGLDDRLKGLCLTELGIIMGPMKRGKSLVACNFARGALFYGKNAIYFGMEGKKEKTEARFDSIFSGVPKDALKDNEELVRAKVKEFFSSSKSGRLVIKHYPAGQCSAWTIEAHLQKLRITTGFVPEIIFIDYLGLLRAADKDMKFEGSSGGRYLMFGEITKELLALAQRGNYAIWLLHQAAKKSLKKIRVGLGDSADSAEPMRHADVIVTLSQSKEERKLSPEQMRLYVPGGREVADNWEVLFVFDKATGILREPDSEV